MSSGTLSSTIDAKTVDLIAGLVPEKRGVARVWHSISNFVRKKPLGAIGAVFLFAFIGIALLAPQLATHDPDLNNYRARVSAPLRRALVRNRQFRTGYLQSGDLWGAYFDLCWHSLYGAGDVDWGRGGTVKWILGRAHRSIDAASCRCDVHHSGTGAGDGHCDHVGSIAVQRHPCHRYPAHSGHESRHPLRSVVHQRKPLCRCRTCHRLCQLAHHAATHPAQCHGAIHRRCVSWS